MRPVELKVFGLRSYRGEQVIDFTGVDLMAIIGDTGAGKSSLLEAICFALYGVCTWPVQGGGGGPLIASSGDGLMRVEFTFRVKNETWKVTRAAASRGVTPPHHLECLDTGEEVDGSRKVTERITALIGLDSKTFLRAVMLPQGKFQELLQSSDSERNALLKSVLDLDSLSEMRKRAKAMIERLTRPLHETELRRRELPADPAAGMADASRRFTQSSKVLERLEAVQNRVGEARVQAEEAGRREKELRRIGKRLGDKSRAGLQDEFAGLVIADTRFAEDEVALRQELDQHEAEVQQLKDELEAAEEHGIGVASTASALTVLAATAEQVPAWHEERGRLAAESAAIAESLAELESSERRLPVLAEKTETARKAAELAAGESSTATAEVTECRLLLDKARTSAKLADTADGGVNTRREKVKQLADRALVLGEAHQGATEALEAAQDHLRAAYQADAVAHAAAGVSAGDDCPVCARSLPETYQPPLGADISAAEKSVDDAKKARVITDKAVQKAQELLHKAEGELEREVEAARLATVAREDALGEARARMGAVDLEVADDVLLAAVITAAGAACTLAEATATALSEVRKEHDDLRASIDTAKPLISQRAQNERSAVRSLDSRWKAIEDNLRKLPFYREAEITPAAIQAAVERAQTQEIALGHLRDRQERAETAAGASRKNAEKLRQRRDEQIEKQRAALVEELSVLVERASVVLTALDREGIPGRGSEPALADDAAWAADTVVAVASALEACLKQADACQAEVTELRHQIAFAYAGVEASDEDHLEVLVRSTNVEVETARRERREAERALPVCQELDARLAAARPLVEGLHELVKLLADGKFVDSVVQRRQGTLLGTASQIFESMTDGRFGFAPKFKIVDTTTGQVRDVKTLSGGETFLASLALALALVEVTSRGAGRVEALFLDEGFGTLDTNALHQALGELHRNAGDGRLVAVISHMRDVADDFENILMVEKSPRGSSARWLSPEERDELMADDLASGLRS
ncbi:AAA family ATPase [Lentzea sp. NPDC092896]|uniref:AAA family ATPase n=1 Tax=Lentzea sp. NPDC092896 TaxID=3364127 RepID=UPI0037FE27EA